MGTDVGPFRSRLRCRSRRGVKTKKALEMRHPQEDDDITVVRRASKLEPMAPTMRMLAIDAELLALARGDAGDTVLDEEPAPVAEPDPFGGLEPVFEDSASICPPLYDEEEEVTWVRLHAVPFIAISEEELAALPLDHRHGFFLCRIDGKRSLAEIAEVTGLPDAKVRALVEVLLALGVIDLR